LSAAELTPEQAANVRRFIIKLGKTMHEYGTPSHHLERLLIDTTNLLGLQGTFMATPTAINFAFWRHGSDQEVTHLARVEPNDIDLNRLSQTHDLAEKVIQQQISLEEGIAELHHIRHAPDPYPQWLNCIMWGLSSAGFAALCSTGFTDIIVSLFAGLLVFALILITQKYPRYQESLEPASAFFIALISSGLASLGFNVNLPVVILSGIIIFIPGLSMTLGLRELAARQLVSGTARVMDATMMMFKLFFGAVFGLALGNLLWEITPHTAVPSLSIWVNYIAVVVLTCTLLVLFKVRAKDLFWSFLAGVIAYSGTMLGNRYFGVDLGSFFGAMVVGIYANAYARINNTPSHVVLLTGVVLLVPGSKAYMELSSVVIGQEILSNSLSGAQVFLSFISIVAGLIFANAVIPPKYRQ
jgi:uncharacterized membrane protein YjjP (DUF1212 family)